MSKIEIAIDAIKTGNLVDAGAREDWPELRSGLQDFAGKAIDQGQDIHAMIALAEVKRLDSFHAKETGLALIPLIFILAAVALLAAAPCAAQASAAPLPSILGATVWQGTSGSLQMGLALPLARWKSLFKLGDGELVALIGKQDLGLGIGHRFRDVQLELGRASVGAALGLGYVVPWSDSCTATASRSCATGLRAGRPVFWVTFPMEVKP